MLEDDYAWLRGLGLGVRDPDWIMALSSLRRFTDEELQAILGLVVKHGLPCTIQDLNMSVGMTIYEKPLEASYPGVGPEDLQPKTLLFIPARALPLSCAGKVKDRILFDDGWRVFSRVTHTQANAALLASCGLPEQKAKTHYEY